MTDVKATIRQFILATYLPGESPANLRDDMPLRTSGVLDSLATLGLVSFVEREFGIELDAYETGLESFDRIDDIAALVEREAGGQMIHLAGYLEASALRWPDRPAVVDPDGRSVTYAELNRQADRVAGFLAARGIARGDRVAVVLPKSVEAVAALFGIMKAGAAVRPGRLHRPDRAQPSNRDRLSGACIDPWQRVARHRSGRSRRGSGRRGGRGRHSGERERDLSNDALRNRARVRGSRRHGGEDRERPGVHSVHIRIDRYPQGRDAHPRKCDQLRGVVLFGVQSQS